MSLWGVLGKMNYPVNITGFIFQYYFGFAHETLIKLFGFVFIFLHFHFGFMSIFFILYFGFIKKL